MLASDINYQIACRRGWITSLMTNRPKDPWTAIMEGKLVWGYHNEINALKGKLRNAR